MLGAGLGETDMGTFIAFLAFGGIPLVLAIWLSGQRWWIVVSAFNVGSIILFMISQGFASYYLRYDVTSFTIGGKSIRFDDVNVSISLMVFLALLLIIWPSRLFFERYAPLFVYEGQMRRRTEPIDPQPAEAPPAHVQRDPAPSPPATIAPEDKREFDMRAKMRDAVFGGASLDEPEYTPPSAPPPTYTPPPPSQATPAIRSTVVKTTVYEL